MKLKLTQFFALFLLILVVGVFWGPWLALSRSMETFSVAEYIHIGKTIIANVAVPMRIMMPTTILLIALSLWLYPDKKSTGFYSGVAALVLITAALLITVIIEVPINNEVKTWTAETAPANWQDFRDRWQFFHVIRTFSGLMSAACFIGSMQSKSIVNGH